MAYWTVLRTKARRERYAAEHVDRQGHRFYLPSIEVIRGRGYSRYATTEPLFASYLIVEIEDQWRHLMSTWGVLGVILRGNMPAVLPIAVLNSLRAREKNGVYVMPKFEEGDAVRVNGLVPAYQNHIGIYKGMDKKERAKVLMDILGGKRTVTIDYNALEVA